MINQTNILFFFQAEIHYDPFEQECEEFRERIGEIKEAKNAVKSFINICQELTHQIHICLVKRKRKVYSLFL